MSNLIEQAAAELQKYTEKSDLYENAYDSADQAKSIKDKLVKMHKDGNYHVRVNKNGKHVIDHAYYGATKIKNQIKSLG
jgi:hypothetical protein